MKRALTVNEAAYLAKRSRRTIYFKAEAEMTAKIGRPRKNISKIAQEE